MRALALLALAACTAAAAPAPKLQPGALIQWQPLAAPLSAERIRGADDAPCAIAHDGRLACWGRLRADSEGPAELRDGTGSPMVPVGIDDVADAAMEWFYLCVAQRSGNGGCYALIPGLKPVPQFPSPPVELVPTFGKICARLRDGTAGCIAPEQAYEPMKGIAGATSLSCTSNGTCCANTPQGVRCAGNADADLGIAESKVAAPIKQALPKAIAIALVPGAACVRTADGGAQCWGRDAAPLSRASGVADVAATSDGICVVGTDGSLHCAGDRIPAMKDVRAVHGRCAAHADGTVWCWGSSEYGELGDGHALTVPLPKQVPGIAKAVELNVAHGSSCARTANDHLWCWGPVTDVGPISHDAKLAHGQYVAGCVFEASSLRCHVKTLGDEWDSEDARGAPHATAIALDRVPSTCAVDRGKITCNFGLGDDGSSGKWVPLAAPGKVVDLEPLATGFCARLDDGRVACLTDERWEDDPHSVDTLPKSKLVLVPDVKDTTQLVTGQDSACALTKQAAVWCWDVARPKPRELTTLRGATFLAAGNLHQCAILRGEVWCWGENARGQLGDGTLSSIIDRIAVPVRAKTSFVATQVGVGRDSTCALDDHGHVWCWGGDTNGELGQGRATYSEAPRKVVGLGPR